MRKILIRKTNDGDVIALFLEESGDRRYTYYSYNLTTDSYGDYPMEKIGHWSSASKDDQNAILDKLNSHRLPWCGEELKVVALNHKAYKIQRQLDWDIRYSRMLDEGINNC